MRLLLATKLFVPRPSSRVVPRTRLFERLDDARDAALTLVSAPAGFGKTALVGGWVRERGLPAAWLSLDAGDDDPVRFWSYLLAALGTVDDGIGASARRLLEAPQPPAGETLATIVVNDLAAAARPLVCVLDDYHVITAEPIHQSLAFLLEHLPPGSRLVVNTRADPPWQLARLRASERMVELRAADLRFTDEEARAFLESAGLRLSADEVRALDSRTEGWIAGLQMAALSMQDREDPATFISRFAGSHRFVLDYLAQEVLDQLPERTRAFLVQTSILDRLRAELCDAVTGAGGSQETLETLVQTNLFTEPLDDERRWYRYHQLFADVLRSQLPELGAELVPELHRRASAWFEENGFDEEAVNHALEARDVDRAARLVARTAAATFVVGNQLLVLDWLGRLPEEVVRATPVLALAGVWARFVTGDWEGIAGALELADAAIEAAPRSSDREALEAQLDGIRSWIAYQTGRLEECVELAGAALRRLPADGLVPRQVVSSARGYGLLLLGDTEAARAVAAETLAESRHAGDALTESLAIGLEAQAYLVDGRLADAGRCYERAAAAGTVAGEPLPSVALVHVQLAEVRREQDELDAAERLLQTAIAACEKALGLPEWVFEGNVTLARVLTARGDAEGARRAAERAEDVLHQELVPGGMEPIVGRALEYRVRLWLETGETARAAAWLRERGISVEGELDARRLTLEVLLARTLAASGEHDAAVRVLDRVRAAAGDAPPLGLAVELGVAKALALQELRRDEEAVELLAGAVRAAEPAGYVRLFADGGAPAARLLRGAAPSLPGAGPYLRRLLLACGRGDRDGSPGAQTGLREPLNDRELALLRLFAAGRSNQEIAGELYLSVNTVKWHARNIYGKLGVNRRALAVARAKELGVL